MSSECHSREAAMHAARADLRRRLDAWYVVTDRLTGAERLVVARDVFGNDVAFLTGSASRENCDNNPRPDENTSTLGENELREILGSVHAIMGRLRSAAESLDGDDPGVPSVSLADALNRLDALESRIADMIPGRETRKPDVVRIARADLSRKLAAWYDSYDLYEEDILAIITSLLGNEIIDMFSRITRRRRDYGDDG